MKDFDSLSDEEKRIYDQVVTLKLALGDIEGILEFLSWAKTTASYLSEMEAIKGTPKSHVKLKTYANLSKNLMEFITKTVSTGEPDFNNMN